MGARVKRATSFENSQIAEFTLFATGTGLCLFSRARRESHELFVPRYGGYSGAFKYVFDRLRHILRVFSYSFGVSQPYFPLQPQLCVLPALDITTFGSILCTLLDSPHAQTKTRSFQLEITLPRALHETEKHTLCFSYKSRTASIKCRHCTRRASRVIVGPRVRREINTLRLEKGDALLGYFFVFAKLHERVIIA
jgi:hypothetical protein